MKLFFVDTETTGLDASKCSITELTSLIYIDGIHVDTFESKIKPIEGSFIDPKALEAQKINYKTLMTYTDQREVYIALMKKLGKYVDKFDRLDKFFFIAYNSSFDNNFIREFFKRNGDGYFGSWFFTPDLCVMQLALNHLMTRRHVLENFKLITVAKELGLVFDTAGAHSATFDIQLTEQVYRICGGKY